MANAKQPTEYKPQSIPPAPALSASPLPAEGYVRSWQVYGCNKRGIIGVIPESEATFFKKVREGIYPKPIKRGNISLWRVSDIRDLIAKIERGEA